MIVKPDLEEENCMLFYKALFLIDKNILINWLVFAGLKSLMDEKYIFNEKKNSALKGFRKCLPNRYFNDNPSTSMTDHDLNHDKSLYPTAAKINQDNISIILDNADGTLNYLIISYEM